MPFALSPSSVLLSGGMAALRDPDRPVLACPECSRKHPGHARIGNRKATCRTCNRFAQAVRRKVAAGLVAAYPEQAAALTPTIEAEVYERTVTGTRKARR